MNRLRLTLLSSFLHGKVPLRGGIEQVGIGLVVLLFAVVEFCDGDGNVLFPPKATCDETTTTVTTIIISITERIKDVMSFDWTQKI